MSEDCENRNRPLLRWHTKSTRAIEETRAVLLDDIEDMLNIMNMDDFLFNNTAHRSDHKGLSMGDYTHALILKRFKTTDIKLLNKEELNTVKDIIYGLVIRGGAYGI